MSSKLEKHLFNLKFAAKELERHAKKCEKSEREEKVKLKKAIQKGNMEGARIHGENCIRQKNQALNYRRLNARVDAVAARVQTALTTKNVMGSMAGVVKAMESALKSMNLEKIASTLDRFETQFENLDVQSQVMESTMSASSTLSTPQNQVDSLMQEVADEAGLELNMDLPSAQAASVGASTAASTEQMAAKQMERSAKKCEKEEKAEKLKLKKAIQKGNMEGARIYSENSIRQKNQNLHFLHLSTRIDAVSQRVQTAVTMKNITKSMVEIVTAMDSALGSMNLEETASLMDRFEAQFEDLDVQSQVMESTMSASSTLSIPQNQVNSLIQEVADEAGLELNMDLPSAQANSIEASTAPSTEQDELSHRLQKLRQM